MTWFLTLVGCPGQPPLPGTGVDTHLLFPFDCERHWEFISTDTTIPYKLFADSNLEPEQDDEGDNVYTVVYSKQCQSAGADCVTGDIVRKVQFSSPVGDGVTIHGYAEGGGTIVSLEPPVELTLPNMDKLDAVTTETAGLEWTGTLAGIEQCPVRLTADWDECYKFELTVASGDELGAPLTGTYWAIGGQGVVALQLSGDSGRWELSSEDHEGDCNGQW